MGKSAASKQLDQANADKQKWMGKIESFKYGQNTEGLSNPFADVTNPFASLTNQYGNLRVATGGADYQRQANSESFANILDATTQGPGGGAASTATALAQQARQANAQIGAGLQQQEAQNQQLSAQGAAQVDQLQAQGQAQMEQLHASGKQYILGLQEQRDSSELAGLGNLYAGAQQSANAALQAKAQSKAAIFGAIGSIAGAALTPVTGGLGKKLASGLGL